MSENDEHEGESGTKKTVLKIDRSPEIDRFMKEQEKIKSDFEKQRLELEALKKEKETSDTKKAELEATLSQLAEKEFESKKAELIKLAEADKDLIGEEKLEEIKESIKTPADLERTEFMLKMLDEAMKVARSVNPPEVEPEKPEEVKKPSGIVSLVRKDKFDIMKRPFNTPEEAVGELYKLEREAKTPEERTKYTDMIKKLWEKAIKEERKRYEGMSINA